jgi:enamine deaminase RidA (YjgF/YER057c/UK114 family)
MSIERIAPGPRMSGAVVHGNTVYLSGRGDPLTPANPPARATVEAKLASPDYLVEISVIAARL